MAAIDRVVVGTGARDYVRVLAGMKLMRTVAAAGIAKKLYDESRKPENRAKIQAAVERVRARRKPGR